MLGDLAVSPMGKSARAEASTRRRHLDALRRELLRRGCLAALDSGPDGADILWVDNDSGPLGRWLLLSCVRLGDGSWCYSRAPRGDRLVAVDDLARASALVASLLER